MKEYIMPQIKQSKEKSKKQPPIRFNHGDLVQEGLRLGKFLALSSDDSSIAIVEFNDDGRFEVRTTMVSNLNFPPKEIYIQSLSDFSLELGQLKKEIESLIKTYGEKSVLKPDAGYNNVSFILEPAYNTLNK